MEPVVTHESVDDTSPASVAYERSAQVLLIGIAITAIGRLLYAITAEPFGSDAIAPALNSDVALVALLVAAGTATILGAPRAFERAVVMSAVIHFAGTVIAAAILLYKRQFASEEILGLLLGSLLGRGGFTVVLILLTVHLRPEMNRLPTLTVCGLVALASSSGFYTAWDLVNFVDAQDGLGLALVSAGNWILLAAAALVLASRPNLALSRFLQRASWAAVTAITIGLALWFTAGSGDGAFGSVESFRATLEPQFFGFLGVAILCAALGEFVATKIESHQDASQPTYGLGLSTALTVLFWPTGLASLFYAVKAQAAADAGDTEAAERSGRTATMWRIVTAMLAALFFVVILAAAA